MSENYEKNDATMPQVRGRGGNNAKPLETRVRFIHAFEKTYGNISASCEYAGIDRRTYYRWIKSQSRVNRKFQKRILAIRPKDRLVDVAEARLMEKVEAGEMRAIELVLRGPGRDRGYGEHIRPENLLAQRDQLERVAMAFRDFVTDHEGLTADELVIWLNRFADGAKQPVDVHELADLVGLGKLLDRRFKNLSDP